MGPELDSHEREALDAASEAAGAYLEKLGKFDVSLLTPDEWKLFLRAIYIAATDRVRDLNELDDDTPF